MTRTIHLVSLGCPKNRVDTEMMADVAIHEGYRMTDDPREADVIVVNTCAFIEDAKRESISTIFDLAQAKTAGRCRKLVVAGCLAERYASAIAEQMPQVDHVMGLGRLETLRAALRGAPIPRGRRDPRIDFPTARYGRMQSVARHSAFVKIGDGCNRRCAFCAIPAIRGRARSRPVASIVSEIRALASAGVREICLVSQDTASYGRDLAKRTTLVDLLVRLERIQGLDWIRVLYLYPDRSIPSLVPLLAGKGPILPYVDLPMQHVTDRMLGIMRRGHGRSHILRTIDRLRAQVPDLTLRTTFIVGHPQETDDDFEALLEFLEEQRPDRIGILRYSAEEGTRSALMPGQVPRSTSARRLRLARGLAGRILEKKNRGLSGKVVQVMVDGPSTEGPYLFDARLSSQAPEVDGKVVVARSERPLVPGSMATVRVTRVMGADLLADVEP